MGPDMENTNPFITDVVVAPHTFKDGSTDSIKWYQFKIPIDQYDTRVGETFGYAFCAFGISEKSMEKISVLLIKPR